MCPERTTSRKAEVPGLVFVVWQNEQTMYEAVRRVKLVKERFSPTSERLLSLFPSRSPEDRQVGRNLKRFMGLCREMLAVCSPQQHVEFEVEWGDGRIFIVGNNQELHHVYTWDPFLGHEVQHTTLLQLCPTFPVTQLSQRLQE